MGAPPDRRQESLHRILLTLLTALPEQPERFRSAIHDLVTGADVAGWRQFLSYAGYHGVLGVIDAALAEKIHVPEPLREAAATRLAMEDLWSAFVARGLETAVAILAAAKVQACALKGPALAARLYPTPARRRSIDVDFLVRPHDWDRAGAALIEAGFSPEAGATARYLREYGHHLGFSKPGFPAVELHFHAYAGFGVVMPAAALMDRAVWHPIDGAARVLVPAPEDEFIYLAVHAAGHSFIRLVWLYDLKLMVQRHPALDWDQIARRSQTLGVMSAVAFATHLLRAWLDVGPHEPPDSFGRRNARSWMAWRLLSEVSRPQPRSLRDNLGGLLFTSLLCDTPAAGAWLLQHHLIRMARRRLHRAAPNLLPESWSA